VESSESIEALAGALAKAQSEIEDAVKDAKNPHLKNRYASLTSVLASVRPALSRHGLAVTQWPSHDGEEVEVVTVLVHASGEWMRGRCSAPYQAGRGQSSVQAVGSAITYLRRYSLMALVGIAPEDDDGNAAAGRRTREPRDARAARQSTHDWTWEADRALFCAELGRLDPPVPYDVLARWCVAHDRLRPSQMAPANRVKALRWLQDGGAATVHAWSQEGA